MSKTLTIRKSDLIEIVGAIERIEEELENLKEEVEILANRELVVKIDEGLKDKEEGRVHGLEEFKKAALII
ncbi:MAG: hypothetical protein V3T58_04585 [Candidatus Hydrothermarchaeales archaeon]